MPLPRRTPRPRPLSRERWTLVEPILTRALAVPAAEGQAIIQGAPLDEALRAELMDLLHLTTSSPHWNNAGNGATQSPTAPPAGAVALRSGDAINDGRFVVVRQIGRGGMGEVFLAQDTVLGTLVALKVVPPDERLLLEAQRAAACSGHDSIATIHNVLTTEHAGMRIGVLVMEYVAGRPASRVLDDGPVQITRVIQWMRQAAAAVAHAHDREVLHCDLKPGNIMVLPDDRIKVLDFGIARASFDRVDPGIPAFGTLPYMAPEQLFYGEFSRATDIYSLGVTLFELVTRQLPFSGDDSMVKVQIGALPPPPLTEFAPDAPVELEKIVRRALAKDPEDRFRSARELTRELDEVEALLGARDKGTGTQNSDVGRIWTVAAGIGGVILVAVLAFGFIACRTFEVVLRIDPEFGASFADYVKTGWFALVPFVLVWGMCAMAMAVLAALARIAPAIVVRQWRRVTSVWTGSDPVTLAVSTFLIGVAGWAALTWYYKDVFLGLIALQEDPINASVGAIRTGPHTLFAWASAVLSFLLLLAAFRWIPKVPGRDSADAATVTRFSWATVGVALIVMLGPTAPRRFVWDHFSITKYAGGEGVEVGRTATDVLIYDATRRTMTRMRRDFSTGEDTRPTRQIFAN